MRRLALASLVTCVFVTLWGVVSAEKVCYFSQEPDARQPGRLRWVMPGSKEDRCACTKTRPGPVNVQPVRWSHPPFYTDTPIFTDDQEDIHDYFDCHDPCQPNPCRYNAKCEKDGDSFKCDCERDIKGDRCDKPLDCLALYRARIRESGVYTIYPSQYPEGLQVYCDGNRWIVFQKRFDGSVNFTRNWTEYQDGFGELSGEFWLGNEKVRQLTSKGQWVLDIEAVYDGTSKSNQQRTWRWPFRVEGDSYKLVVEGFTDGWPFLSIDTPHAFSTYDRDNDDVNGTNCAEVEGGGWWFGQCESPQDSWGNLNGEYSLLGDPDNTDQEYRGMKWNVTGNVIVVRSSQMKLRSFTPRDCERLYDFGVKGNGTYTIYPAGKYKNRMKVYCDMDTEPKGWIVFQKRFDGSVNFTRNWTEYQDGFGELSGEFWLGNEKVRQLTSKDQWVLEIEVVYDDRLKSNKNMTFRWPFRVEGDSYKLVVEGFTDDLPFLSIETPHAFSTYDRDNDDVNGTNCAEVEGGGWWFGQCGSPQDSWGNFNGEYSLLGDPDNYTDREYRGMKWNGTGNVIVVRSSQMKLRRFTPSDCQRLYNVGVKGSGIYTIYPAGKYKNRMKVYCDMDTEPNGWIVFQKRFDGSVNFTRNWTEYRDGFGDLSGEFWLGNEKLRLLTSTHRWALRVDLVDDQGKTEQINVNKFSVKGNDYTLGRDSPASDFPQFNQHKFSTYDNDQDDEEPYNCADRQGGGWWFGACSDDISYSLNGKYHDGGLKWTGWAEHVIVKSIVKCEMKLRRY
ncbi:uncharacterized protein LOC119731866 [Patiria miniata]|uniref:Uncharacterized protein n=1 Tax=Patiria miniata TaxID=46514 RepID=A0A914ABF8_PATMI|nr:uncharacterized protein LOC119731866 [Patiria miniata]